MNQYKNLKAIYINTSLKKHSEQSHTGHLLAASANILEKQGLTVEKVHMLDYEIPPGVYPDMTEHGWSGDDWPKVWEKIKSSDILVVGTPIWLGEESSVCRVLIERLYAMSGELNAKGQSIYYGKVGGCVITGNEDGIKHVAMTVGYALSHLGYTIPPQADCGWIGEAGPGPSYGDKKEDGSYVGFDNDFTMRNTTIMSWNLMHMASILKQHPLPNHGNDRRAWKSGSRFDFENPEYRV
ncbi:MAG TPA: NAD(P)H-dependent oxidoreductase [Oligoflexia bacterium]|nr:NAD(P)H-dependent oxidoreductase [Oligoflexia bacterium]HMR24651.1 NAD(P)H-dependent oxidoreductase [Oligoflexia bacterium]